MKKTKNTTKVLIKKCMCYKEMIKKVKKKKYTFAKLLFIFLIIFSINSSNAGGLFDVITDKIPSVELISNESLFPSDTIKGLIPKDTSTVKINRDIPRLPSYDTGKITPNLNLWSYLNPDFLNVIKNHLMQLPDIEYMIGRKTREQFEQEPKKSVNIKFSLPSMFEGKVIFLNQLPNFPYMPKYPTFVNLQEASIEDLTIYLDEILPNELPTAFTVEPRLDFIIVENPEDLLKILENSAMVIIP